MRTMHVHVYDERNLVGDSLVKEFDAGEFADSTVYGYDQYGFELVGLWVELRLQPEFADEFENEPPTAKLRRGTNGWESTKTTQVRSRYSGKMILPTTTDAEFESIWYALLEYKRDLENDIFEMTKTYTDNSRGGHGKQRIVVEVSDREIEDQAFLYSALAKQTALVNEYFDRARELGLI